MDLIPISSAADFRFSALIPKNVALTTPSEKAAAELLACFDGIWAETPVPFRDFTLRFFKSCGMPLAYEELPFWLLKPARHVFTICYPTVRKSDFRHPTTEDFGRVAGHLWAIIRHAKDRTAIFEKLPGPTVEALRAFLLRLESPVGILIQEGISQAQHESGKFMAGMAFAYVRTFDVTGMPKGWDTTSRVYLGICIVWRLLATRAMSFAQFHSWLEDTFGKQEIGHTERVKKLCDRIGFKFEVPANISESCQQTIEISDVRGTPLPPQDK
jgi:hypothetical protein